MTRWGGAAFAVFALWLAPARGAQFPEPHVCVPGADGRSWECGRGADAPAPRPLPNTGRPQQRATAPLLLTDPAKLPQLRPGGPMVAPGAVERMPAPTDSAAAPPADLRSTVPSAAPAVVARPEAATPERADPRAERRPGGTGAASAARAEAARPPATPAPTFSARAASATGVYTVQLAGARSPAGFLDHLRALGLDPKHAFMAETERAGGPWWVLLYGRYDSRAAAKSALDPLPEGAWTRSLSEFGPGTEWLSIR